MAMIKCLKCGEEISDKAKRCPHCNTVLKKNKLKYIIIAIVSVALVITLVYCGIIGTQHYQQYKAIEQQNKVIQEYNESVYETVREFHDTFQTVDEKLHNRNYASLSSLISTLEKPIKEFDELPINEESEVGLYIKSIRNNPMYLTFKSIYINSDEIDLDYGLTSSGHAYVLTVYTEEILKTELPVIEK